MEAMALVAIHMAFERRREKSQGKINMQDFFERSLCASIWVNVQRSNTTKREMDFFKERRQSLFFQWGLTGRGVLSQQRDCMGNFSRPEDERREKTDTEHKEKRRKLDLYGNVFPKLLRRNI